METEVKSEPIETLEQLEMPEQQETSEPKRQDQPEQMEAQEQTKEQPEKKQELKDFSLSPDVLIKELSEAEVAKLFSAPKKIQVSLKQS